ncbi:protein kinase domain-containing protein [Colletotrichum plurivorum]|uniref:Protein kinase domain-containing protein n=1 Tax=Colletotrichum plurivorum TaxID=2175906 RepID=A0A8H6JSL2_9PEZI|nr:protein kinase domain-containing protein [Colletotrichum plurivorum]
MIAQSRVVEDIHTYGSHAVTSTAINDVQSISNATPVSSEAHGLPYHGTPRIVTDAPVAWHDGFAGGSAVGNFDYDRIELSILHPERLGGRSEAGETDDVLSVHDLGFSAVRWPTQHLRSRRPSQSDVSDHISCRGHLENDVQPAAEIEDGIRRMIESNLSWSEMDQEEYLPVDAFEKIFDINTIMSLIQAIYGNATEQEIIHKAGQIWGDDIGSRRRIIATLVFMKQTSRIEDFIQEKIYDHHLPLCHESKSRKEFRTLVDGDRTNTTLFRNWERVHVDLFYVYQKMIFIPFLSMGDGIVRSYVFDSNVRLPWNKFEQKMAGGHGTIHRLEIHQSHHDYNRNDHGNTPYLVFEWADGNLEEFWKQRQVEPSPAATSWMAQQCWGITNAIKRIHGLTTWQKEERSANPNSEEMFVKDWGRHGDIKPANILWFLTHGKDRDHLVVADLGLTRYHSSLTKSRVKGVDGWTGTYRAPEIDLSNPISARYDIWSLGCVFLEFCIWYLLGYDDVENFRRARNLDRGSDDADDIEEPDHSYFVTWQMPRGGKRAELHPAVQKRHYNDPCPQDHLQVLGASAGLVRFAEGNSIIPDSVMSSVNGRDRALSIASVDTESYDGSWNDHSTADSSVC